ncbi:MAG: phage holin family protein [Gemmatimonadetes bacterium]|nr:phage holin family protein [Gemmatimonadota bacterium]NNK48953.1 phage holin family protein [Gemmatimonadota bacterium]
MLEFILHLVVSALLLIVVAKIVDGVEVDGFVAALFAAAVMGLANAFLAPIAALMALPINILTFGLLWWLIRWVINALMMWLTSAIVTGFKVSGFSAAFWGAAVLTIGNLMVSWIF